MFETTFLSEQSVPCLVPEGRIDTVNSPAFDLAVQNQLDKTNFLIIDLSRCSYLSSSGIRVLLGTFKKLKAKGGALYITHVAPEVFQVFEMAGLHQVFRFANSCEAAADEINLMKKKTGNCCEWEFDGYTLQFHPLGTDQDKTLMWIEPGIAGYDELGFAVGTGYSADQNDELSQGVFVTTGNCAGFVPFGNTGDGELPSDFRIPQNPSQAGVLVHQALSFGNNPAGWFRMFKHSGATLGRLAENIYRNRKQLNPESKGAMALIVANYDPVSPGLSVCFAMDETVKSELAAAGMNDFRGAVSLNTEGLSLWGAKFDCEELAQPSDNPVLENSKKEILTIENIANVRTIDPSEKLTYPLVWVFMADSFDDASAYRIQLEAPSDFFSEPYKAFLTRRLYRDSKRVVIKPLHGGYSAQTFQVNSFDKEGRRLRPTVLKIADRAMITREAERCRKYSLPYILNNSAMVLGTEFFGDRGALCYNFVGIGGDETRLKWLTNYFDEWPVEELLPIFDKTFLQILKPWYGQPVRATISLFKDHDPTLTFFPALCETAENTLSISADEPSIYVGELGRELMNPYYFLKHEYLKRRDETIDYYTSICHGDLNMQNILLDETMNVYLIDFSETRPRSVVSDFARMEAIFIVERSPLENEQEMAEMVRVAEKLYTVQRLDQFPENSYGGKHVDIVKRNVTLTQRMREYALTSASGNVSIFPYYMALLEWVLPIVCFRSASTKDKYFSMVVAGLLCEQVADVLKK